jgi:hypothetical protein
MTLGSHQKTVGDSQNWITPRWIIDRLGPFDLDPAAASPRPWDCAAHNLTDRGLELSWTGRVWLNPPFDRYQVGKSIQRLADYGNGTVPRRNGSSRCGRAQRRSCSLLPPPSQRA